MPAHLPKKPSQRFEPLKAIAADRFEQFYKRRAKGKKSTKQYEEERQEILNALDDKAKSLQKSKNKPVVAQARLIIERAERRARADSLRGSVEEELGQLPEKVQDFEKEDRPEPAKKQKTSIPPKFHPGTKDEQEEKRIKLAKLKAEKEEEALRKDIEYEAKMRKRNHELELQRLDKVEEILKQMTREENEMQRQEKAQRQAELDADLDRIVQEKRNEAEEKKRMLVEDRAHQLQRLREKNEQAAQVPLPNSVEQLTQEQLDTRRDVLKARGIGTQNIEEIDQERETELEEREESAKRQRTGERIHDATFHPGTTHNEETEYVTPPDIKKATQEKINATNAQLNRDTQGMAEEDSNAPEITDVIQDDETVDVDNFSTVAVASEQAPEIPQPGEEPSPTSKDTTQQLQNGAGTNGTDESIQRGENATGGVVPPGASAPPAGGNQRPDALEGGPGQNPQEEMEIEKNADVEMGDNIEPAADSSETNAQLQEAGQPMEEEATPNAEEQQQAKERQMMEENSAAAEKQEEIAVAPEAMEWKKTIDKGMDGVDWYYEQYDIIFGEAKPHVPPESMDTSTTEPKTKFGPQADVQSMEMEKPFAPYQEELISTENPRDKERRLKEENKQSDIQELLDKNKERRNKIMIYYDPKDSSAFVTLNQPQHEITNNPFGGGGAANMQVERPINAKDRAMAEMVFHQRDPKGGIQKRALKDILKERKDFWKQEDERLKEYHSMAAERQAVFLAERQKADKEELDQELKQNLALRAARTAVELNEYNQTQFNKMQSQFTSATANKKFLYPSLVDRSTRNVIEYAKDANGNYLRDPVTGGPIIATSWAVERDDAERLRQQRATADGMVSKKPYFPIFGKAAKKFFSKAEYCQLARMMGDKGDPYPETIMRTEKTIDRKLGKLYKKLSRAMSLPGIPGDVSKKKVLLELQTLEQAFAQYSTSALYDYPNTIEEADKQNDLDNEFESAIKTLERVTMGQLLQKLAAQKADEIQQRDKNAAQQQGFKEGAQQLAQEQFPTFPRARADQPGVYTGVGRGDPKAQARALKPQVANPAQPPPSEEVQGLFNPTLTVPNDQGQALRDAEAKVQFWDPIQSVDPQINAGSSGIPTGPMASGLAPADTHQVGPPVAEGKKQVNPFATGWGQKHDEEMKDEWV